MKTKMKTKTTTATRRHAHSGKANHPEVCRVCGKDHRPRAVETNLLTTLDTATTWVLLREAKTGAEFRKGKHRVVKMWGRADRILVFYADGQVGMFQWPGTACGALVPSVANNAFIGYAVPGDGHAEVR